MSKDIPASDEVGMHRMKTLVAPLQVAIVEANTTLEALQLTVSVVMTLAMNFCERAKLADERDVTPVDVFSLALAAYGEAEVAYEKYTEQKKRAEGK
jgi:hypothetical protein